MSNQLIKTESKIWKSNKALIKALLIAVLTILLMLPQSYISDLVTERENRQTDIQKDVCSKWANAQTIIGPILMIPYNQLMERNNGTRYTEKMMLYILPESLKIGSFVNCEKRNKGIYQVSLYKTNTHLSGNFQIPPLEKLNLNENQIIWSEAKLIIGIEDIHGLAENVELNWNNNKSEMENYMEADKILKSSLFTPVSISKKGIGSFDLTLKFKGSEQLNFLPGGKNTEINVQSDWINPLFTGAFLPNEKPIINQKGFSANWKIIQIARGFPSYWTSETPDFSKSLLGIKFLQPTTHYSEIERSIKYSILFIALSFGVFFFIENLQKKPIHPIQYLMVGFALLLFYTLLLSISEYIGFNFAYLIATIAIISLITMYVNSIFIDKKIKTIFPFILIGLYSYIFIITQMQDYALLFGSIGLFLILGLLMYFSRRIDWYSTNKGSE